MALQGDLDSFALPDVLRLLAGTGKTGRLDVSGEDATGGVSLDGGTLVGGEVSSAPHAVTAADVVFELLRFERGSFLFDDSAAPAPSGEPSSVDDAIARAEGLLQEWEQVSAVVTSVHSWVAITPELPNEEVTIGREQWRVLSVLGAGATVRDVANHFELTDLVASRMVKDLVESGLVELTAEPTASIASEPAPHTLGDQNEESYDDDVTGSGYAEDEYTPAPSPAARHAFLEAEDGPVVLDASDDALLPEPLPGEGTTFEGDLSELGSVDPHNLRGEDSDQGDDSGFDIDFGSDPGTGEFGRGEYGEAETLITPSDPRDPLVDPFSPAWEDPVAAQQAATDPALQEQIENEERAWGAFTAGDEMVDHLAEDQDDSSESPDQPEGSSKGDDSDRGSLLKFLSTVKP